MGPVGRRPDWGQIMSELAPVDMVLVEFPSGEFDGAVTTELERLVAGGTIDILDLLLVTKDADGVVRWAEAEEVDDRLARLVGDPAGMLADEDIQAVAEELAQGSSVGMMLFEHTWAAGFSKTIHDAGGRLLVWERVSPATVDELADLVG